MAVYTLVASLAVAAAFQDYSLGMSLEEARAVPISEDKYGAVKLTCSSDGDAPRSLRTTEAEGKLGVERCWPTQWIGGSHVRASLVLGGGVSATTEFLFLKGRLFQIETVYDETHREPIERALRQKFGNPAVNVDGVVQNLYGAEFEQKLITWEVGDDRVTLVAPALTLKRMIVSYRDVAISDEVSRAIEDSKAAELSL